MEAPEMGLESSRSETGRRYRNPSASGLRAAGAARLCIGVIACVAASSGCRERPGAGGSTSDAAQAPKTGADLAALYADDASCERCHSDIVDTYAKVSMSKSLYRYSPQTRVEDLTNNKLHHEATGRYYEMTERDGRLHVRRYQLGADGERFNVFEIGVDWVIGSGNHVRSYLFQNEVGELYQMPISWYARAGWQMSPGFDVAGKNDFSREVTRECMFCHNAYPDVAPGSDRFGAPDVFPRDLPHGIGCQRCHGPGAAHVRLADDRDATIGAVVDAIVNPANLEPALREDVCLQCHLQPTSKLTVLMRRFGRSHYSYRPGQPLSDYLVHFDVDSAEHAPAERFEINHHPYRLAQSACYQESPDGISCLTCHNPHRKVAAVERAEHYRDRCLTCHEKDDCDLEQMSSSSDRTGIAPDDCVACHMGQRVPDDVTHVVMTDHKIQRRPAPLAPRPASSENEPIEHPRLRFYHSAGAPREPLAALYHGVTLSRSSMPNKQLLREAISRVPKIADAYWYLGADELADREFARAEKTFARALELAPQEAWPHVGLAKALQRLSRHAEALEHFGRAAERTPHDPQVHLGRGRSLRDLGQLEAARGAFEEALRLRPTYAEALHDLGILYARQRRYDQAERTYRQALTIEPTSRKTAADLGAVLMFMGRFSEAVRYWRYGAELEPRDGTIREWLAQLYLTCPDPEVRDLSLGLVYARDAFERDRDRASAIATLAHALLVNDAPTEALEMATNSLKAGGDELNGNLIRSIALNRLGRTTEARDAYAVAQRLLVTSRQGDAVRRVLLKLAARETGLTGPTSP